LAQELALPSHVEIVAYLCVGHVEQFPSAPELALAGWATRRPLSWSVHHEDWGHRALPGRAATAVLDDTLAAVAALDPTAMAEAAARQDNLTKPRGSLGVLEAVSIQLAGLAGACPPPMPEPAVIAVFAADHGVYAQGVTPWPQEVTGQMVANFLAGGAVINAVAAQMGAEVVVVDVGVDAELDAVPGLLPRKIRRGTADLSVGPAMSRAEAVAAVEVGIELARDLVGAGNRCLLTGDMGIANTTASAALIAVFTGADPAEVTGRGTGVDDATHELKIEVIARALALHRPDADDPIGVLAAVGGLEHAAIAGFVLGAAALRTPVILDGVIAGAAALVAAALAPDSVGAMIAGHCSSEPGAARALDHLGLRPLVDLDLRLGEGSGAALSLGLVQSAVRILREVSTFDSAGVTDKDGAGSDPS
jgi:nicotinate-nucleotide--dimethylbenzimidazole phosphoribosyltransferase